MIHTPDIEQFLDDLTGRYAVDYEREIGEMRDAVGVEDRYGVIDARNRLVEVIRETMGVAEVVGATMALRNAATLVPGDQVTRLQAINFADSSVQRLLPRVTFEEAVQDMTDRVPVTVRRAGERTAAKISELYGGVGTKHRSIVAFAKSAEAAVTKRVQEHIRNAIRDGTDELVVGKRIVRSVAQLRERTQRWTQNYARMVFRTNLNTAVTAGRFRQVLDPDIREVIPAFRFDHAGDNDVRDTHRALGGIILAVDNPKWRLLAPPIDYNCRCRLSDVTLPMLHRMGRIRKSGSIVQTRIPKHVLNTSVDSGFRHGGRLDLALV